MNNFYSKGPDTLDNSSMFRFPEWGQLKEHDSGVIYSDDMGLQGLFQLDIMERSGTVLDEPVIGLVRKLGMRLQLDHLFILRWIAGQLWRGGDQLKLGTCRVGFSGPR